MNRIAIVATGAAALLALSACSSSSSGKGNSTPPAKQSANQITIKNFAYSGALTVKPGTKITIVDEDSVAHTVTDKTTHKFDSGNIDGSGGTATITAPSQPGKYKFGCTLHPQMSGTLTVTG